MKSCTEAFLHASIISSSVASSFAILILFLIVSLNRCVSCVTKLSIERRLSVLICSTDLSEIVIVPLSVLQNLIKSLRSVDLPLPLLPEIPIMLPFGTGIDTSESIVSSPYENVTFSAAAPLNSRLLQSVISLVTGCSSRISSTLFPAANVFCNVLPRLARATTGPKELIIATTDTNTPAKLTAPLPYKEHETIIITRSATRITVLVTAMLIPVSDFNLLSSSDKLSVLLFISSSLSMPQLYCKISGRPLKLSNTKLLNSPDFVLNVSPVSLLALDIYTGTHTPTAT